jgi:histone H3/H4
MVKTYFPSSSVRKLLFHASPGAVSSGTVNFFILILKILSQKIAMDSRRMTAHAQRKTMTPEDIQLACEKHIIKRELNKKSEQPKCFFFKTSIRNLIQDITPGPVSNEALEFFIEILTIMTYNTAMDARIIAKHGKREAIRIEDVLLAIEKNANL